MAFVLRRRLRRHRSDSPATSQLSGPGAEQLGGGGEKRGRVWTTVASGRGAGADPGGGYEGPGAEQRYAGNWSRVIHGDILRHGAGAGAGYQGAGAGYQGAGADRLSVDTGTGTRSTKTGSLGSSEESYEDQLGVSLAPGLGLAPSLPETHFSPDPLAPVLHTLLYPDPGTRKPASVRSADIMAAGRDSGVSFLSSRCLYSQCTLKEHRDIKEMEIGNGNSTRFGQRFVIGIGTFWSTFILLFNDPELLHCAMSISDSMLCVRVTVWLVTRSARSLHS